jgi:hypothetical protein
VHRSRASLASSATRPHLGRPCSDGTPPSTSSRLGLRTRGRLASESRLAGDVTFLRPHDLAEASASLWIVEHVVPTTDLHTWVVRPRRTTARRRGGPVSFPGESGSTPPAG